MSHLRNVLTGTLPWGLFLPVALVTSFRGDGGDRHTGTARAALWCLSGLLFFTLAARKSPYYLLPLYPAVALVIASWLWQRAGRLDVEARTLVGALELAAALIVLAVGAAVVFWLRHVEADVPEIDAFLAALRASPIAVGAAVAALPLLSAAAIRSTLGGDWRAAVPRFWLATFLALAIAQHTEPVLAEELSMRPFAEAVRREVGSDPELYFYLRPARSIAFYAGRDIATLAGGEPAPDKRFWLIVRGPFWESLPEAWRSSARIVAAREGRVVTSRKMKVLLIEVGSDRPAAEAAAALHEGATSWWRIAKSASSSRLSTPHLSKMLVR